MARLRYNGLTAELAGSGLDATGTAVTFAAALTHSGGTSVPTISGSDYIPLTILNSAGSVSEIVYLTAYTSGATTGTISRAQESTAGVSHAVGAVVVHGPTRRDFTATDINAQTGTSYTLTLADAGGFVTMTNGAASTLTVPPNSSTAFPVGTFIEGAQLGAGQVTIAPGSGVTINGTPGLSVAAQYGAFRLLKIGTDTWLASGDLGATPAPPPSYADEVLADSPVFYYKLDETAYGSGAAADASGNGRNGSYSTSLITFGKTPLISVGTSIGLASGSQTVTSPAVTKPQQWTIELWTKTTMAGSGNTMFSLGDSLLALGTLTAGAPRIYHYATGVGANSSVTIHDGAVHHIVATQDATTLRIYVDGVQTGSVASAPGAPSGTATGVVSGDAGGDYDETAYYNTALSAARIAAHYAAR